MGEGGRRGESGVEEGCGVERRRWGRDGRRRDDWRKEERTEGRCEEDERKMRSSYAT